jgi:hypothetical protein
VQALKEQPRFFESALFAGGINAHKHLSGGEDRGESVHGVINNYAHTGKNPEENVAHKKPPPGGGCCANANQAVASDLQLTLYSFVVVVLQAILVAHHLAIQLVYQFIHSGVQVEWALRKQIIAFDADVHSARWRFSFPSVSLLSAVP